MRSADLYLRARSIGVRAAAAARCHSFARFDATPHASLWNSNERNHTTIKPSHNPYPCGNRRLAFGSLLFHAHGQIAGRPQTTDSRTGSKHHPIATPFTVQSRRQTSRQTEHLNIDKSIRQNGDARWTLVSVTARHRPDSLIRYNKDTPSAACPLLALLVFGTGAPLPRRHRARTVFLLIRSRKTRIVFAPCLSTPAPMSRDRCSGTSFPTGAPDGEPSAELT